MPIFAVMISTQAFAEEINYPFGHPFGDHLYEEGLNLLELPNGKFYPKLLSHLDSEVINADGSIEYGETIYQVNDRAKVPPQDSIYIEERIDGDALVISENAWNIVWVEDGSGYDLYEQDDYSTWEKSTFFYIDCMTDGIKHVEISDIHVRHDIESSPGILPTNHPIPYKTLSIHNCETVSIKNSTFKGPVLVTHINIENTKHILIDAVEIIGTEDPNAPGSFYLGGGIAIGGGDKREVLTKREDGSSGTYSTIIKNSYIGKFTAIPMPKLTGQATSFLR